MRVALAFLRRDLLIWSSYRMAIVWQLVGIAVFVGLVSFLGTAVGDARGFFQGQPAGFVAFILSGITFTDVLMQGIFAMPQAIRDNQKDGTLEPMLLTPISTMNLAISSALFRLFIALGRMVIYLILGIAVIGLWRQANFLSLLVVLLSAMLGFLALGILSSAFVIFLKQGDPVLVAYGALTALLGGVLFPVAALPAWIRPFADFVPLTYALSGLRAALDGARLTQVLGPTLVLCGLAAVLMPLGILAFNWAVNRAKKEGSLAQY
jgi:ABC-2 type transport system permease protein